ncbi:cytosolic non-specific dipeptidase-like [Alexandromys fortis]|uniref:cytosolic non-specific dipeptidase-like n=1 Tax=Alexandromys fortis TaxID=100897 RepID=UPI002152CC33|nr:cytosolic non-specific dipeptidase-like [Microtus fortis]
MEEFAKDVGAVTLLHSCKKDILMHRWRYPSLSLHGIEGAFSGSGAKTVIPRKVVGKFSIRLVPDMVPEAVSEQVWGGCRTPVGKSCGFVPDMVPEAVSKQVRGMQDASGVKVLGSHGNRELL